MSKRKIEVRRDGFWVEVPMKDVKAGDTIRMFEPEDAKPVEYPEGNTEFTVVEDATLQYDDIYGCKIQDPSAKGKE